MKMLKNAFINVATLTMLGMIIVGFGFMAYLILQHFSY